MNYSHIAIDCGTFSRANDTLNHSASHRLLMTRERWLQELLTWKRSSRFQGIPCHPMDWRVIVIMVYNQDHSRCNYRSLIGALALQLIQRQSASPQWHDRINPACHRRASVTRRDTVHVTGRNSSNSICNSGVKVRFEICSSATKFCFELCNFSLIFKGIIPLDSLLYDGIVLSNSPLRYSLHCPPIAPSLRPLQWASLTITAIAKRKATAWCLHLKLIQIAVLKLSQFTWRTRLNLLRKPDSQTHLLAVSSRLPNSLLAHCDRLWVLPQCCLGSDMGVILRQIELRVPDHMIERTLP